MAKLAFLLLCHKDPEGIVRQARRLTAAGDCVAIHLDARAGNAAMRKLRAALADDPRVTFARRHRCGWGGWSLVAATLSAARAALEAFPTATHLYMVSGDCMPVKSAEHARAHLDAEDADHIESVDFFHGGWIKTGLREERLVYRHWFNERSTPRLFYGMLGLQQRMRLRRAIPPGLRVMIGSQWWCLRRRTLEAVLDFVRARPDVIRFFRSTWIPDETFFQTLVRHLVPAAQIRSRTPTFLMFSDYGLPVTFYNDHFGLLLAQDALFARKISPEATELKARLDALWTARGETFRISDEGRALHGFLTWQGREGQRFAPRFWERDATLGRERDLMIVICKKWHVAKRLVARIRQATNLPVVEYLFDEDAAGVPDLGGFERPLAKRNRHRRALVRMLFDRFDSDRMVLCLDPKDLAILEDFDSDRSQVKMLEVQCRFSDAYLHGHAERVGLVSASTPEATLRQVLPAVRNRVHCESDRIAAAGFAHLGVLREWDSVEANAEPLASFLDIPLEQARGIAATPHLFAD